MEREYSGHLLTGILLLAFTALLLGFHDLHKDQINERLEREEQEWKESVLRARASRCFRDSYGRVYLVDGELWTLEAESYFNYCMDRQGAGK